MFTDPTGMNHHDYGVNKETGEINLIRETNDKFDRIMETDEDGNIKTYGTGFLIPKAKKGQEKIAVDNIAKGILKDCMNFEIKDINIKVNREGEPTLKEFDNFISKFSDFVKKEIAGVRLGNLLNNSEVTSVQTFRYLYNTRDKSSIPERWMTDYGLRLKGHFHTHPFNDHVPSTEDIALKNRFKDVPFFYNF
ncbi:MPN domain-containing protein [Paenimyroides tangerinum]|uniref:hypothetical protein n=1 Tax=Paenimyroides tangerinum TaxID=2488728 RepID=UPI00193AC392|nr:hypothetical protein [Paenimyroides tangerinum]